MISVRLCLLAILLLAAATFAAIPQTITYQGLLTSPDGAPLDTTVAMTFALYADSIGETPLWSEIHPAVTVANGLFRSDLGSSEPIPDAILHSSSVWLGVQVGGDAQLMPRQRMGSVPFALRAGGFDAPASQDVTQLLQLLSSLPDADGDGHVKMSMGGDDCDDLDPAVYAGAPEICDGKDNDCDRVIDEGLGLAYYRDADHDGYGVGANQIFSCNPPDSGWSATPGDCDDSDPTRHPGATEICDGVDNNCNGVVDEGFQTVWYLDADGDTYGSVWDSVTTCTQPAGYVAVGGDCDDTNPAIHPGAQELCNGIDDDCNGLVDEYALLPWYMDSDGDGYGYFDVVVWACTQPDGFVANDTDCDDSNPLINPAAPEICNNGIDDNCDGQIDAADPQCQ